MPLAGLINSNDARVPWGKIAETYRREDWLVPRELSGGTTSSYPLPLLLALGRNEADHLDDDIHISSLVSDPRREILKRRNDYYETPDQQLYKSAGSAQHLWLNQYAQDANSERRFYMPIECPGGKVVRVTGKMDHIERATLIDYKVVGAYALAQTLKNGIEAEKPEWVWQLRFYAVLAKAQGIEVKPPYYIFAEARDWRKSWGSKAPEPRMAEFAVSPTAHDEDELRRRVYEVVAAMAEPEARMPACNDRHAWGEDKSSGKPKRCLSYCEVNRFCGPYCRGEV